jgi:hypothetical protein
MFTRRSVQVFFALLGLTATASIGAAGCGLGAGDHVFYRVAVANTVSDKSCYKNDTIPDSVKDDSTNLSGGSTFILYLNADKTAELDTGSLVVNGQKTDTGYAFSGESINVEYPIDGIKTTATTQIDITLTIDGKTVTGTTKTVTSSKCEGSACPPDFNTQSCTKTNNFKGVEIEDAEVTVGNGQAAQP